METIEKIKRVYMDIQNLQMQPSKHNVMLLAEALLMIEDIAKTLQEPEEIKVEVENDGSDLSEG